MRDLSPFFNIALHCTTPHCNTLLYIHNTAALWSISHDACTNQIPPNKPSHYPHFNSNNEHSNLHSSRYHIYVASIPNPPSYIALHVRVCCAGLCRARFFVYRFVISPRFTHYSSPLWSQQCRVLVAIFSASPLSLPLPFIVSVHYCVHDLLYL